MARVRSAARALGYVPNFVGRALSAGRTFAIGIVQPTHDSVFNLLYQCMIRGMAEAMEEDGYHLLILFRTVQQSYLRVLGEGRVDGMIVLQSDFETDHIEAMAQLQVPLVVVNRSWPGAGTGLVRAVLSDHERAIREVVDELVRRGRRRLVEVTYPDACDANQRMHAGFVEGVARHAAAGVQGRTLAPPSAYAHAAEQLMAQRDWDGIYTDGIAFANALLEAADRRGQVPGRDFELITTDCMDASTSRTRREAMAWTQQPDTVGRETWRVMRALLAGATDVPAETRIPYRPFAVRADGSVNPRP